MNKVVDDISYQPKKHENPILRPDNKFPVTNAMPLYQRPMPLNDVYSPPKSFIPHPLISSAS